MMVDSIRRIGKTAAVKYFFYKGSLRGVHSKRYRKTRAIILAYHSVCPEHDDYGPYIGRNLTVSPNGFDRQIAYLLSSGRHSP